MVVAAVAAAAAVVVVLAPADSFPYDLRLEEDSRMCRTIPVWACACACAFAVAVESVSVCICMGGEGRSFGLLEPLLRPPVRVRVVVWCVVGVCWCT